MVVIVETGGLPVTEAPGAMLLPDNGLGVPVTIVASGGLPVTFVRAVAPPTLALNSISPTSMPANTQTTLRALGKDFQATSRIEVGGTVHTTNFVNSGELTASIKKNAGVLPVKVKTGTSYTNAINLTVT